MIHAFRLLASKLSSHHPILLKDTLEPSTDAGKDFLDTLRDLPRPEQLKAVNRYANTRDYVLDIDNYGLEDYWAVPREFLYNDGDCEDYAITKLFSLRWLGYPDEVLVSHKDIVHYAPVYSINEQHWWIHLPDQ